MITKLLGHMVLPCHFYMHTLLCELEKKINQTISWHSIFTCLLSVKFKLTHKIDWQSMNCLSKNCNHRVNWSWRIYIQPHFLKLKIIAEVTDLVFSNMQEQQHPTHSATVWESCKEELGLDRGQGLNSTTCIRLTLPGSWYRMVLQEPQAATRKAPEYGQVVGGRLR